MKKPNLKALNRCYPLLPSKKQLKQRPPLPHELVNTVVRELDLPAPEKMKKCE